MIGPAGTFAGPQLSDEFTEEDEAAFFADLPRVPVLNAEHRTVLEMGYGITIAVGSPSDDESHLPFAVHDFGERGVTGDFFKNASPEESVEAKCKCGNDKGDCIY